MGIKLETVMSVETAESWIQLLHDQWNLKFWLKGQDGRMVISEEKGNAVTSTMIRKSEPDVTL